jgi:5-methyltetrahydrofolate--homocysteine methyltransferase
MKPTTSLKEVLRERRLVSDGAMGTQLQAAGLEPGGCGEAWNLTHPERILDIQRRYVEAGADCLTTNTFGGCRMMLERHGHGDEVEAINRAGVEIARSAFGDRAGFVLGDVGPFGGVMEPYGDVEPDEVRRAFEEQARALVSAGVDAIIVETQTSLDELGLAIDGARAAGVPCVIASLAFDVSPDGDLIRTMMGASPEEAAAFAGDRGADVVGLNCGTSIDMLRAREVVSLYRSACDLPIMVQPNAGLPVLEGLRTVYKQTPEQMVEGVAELLEAGAGIVGGCCGTTPEHIRALRVVVDRFEATQGKAGTHR